MADQTCYYCKNYIDTNQERYSTKTKCYCKSFDKYVEPTDRKCSYFIQNPKKFETTNEGCFLTTACIRHMNENFDDNCEELQILREFRDMYVPQEDIDHYYKIAPTIVNILDNSIDGPATYEFLYNDVIKTCVSDIKQGNIGEAYAIYKNTMIYLEERYAKPYLQDEFVLTLKRVRAMAY